MKRGACLVWLALLLWAGPASAIVPPFALVRDGLQPSNVVLLDRHGMPLAEDFRPYQQLRLEWTPLRSLSPATLQTLLTAEDQRFFEHPGVDWRAFVAALWQNLWSSRLRGASTLTMQLAGLLDPALRPKAAHGRRRTLAQKWDQALAAAELEAHWSKEQILEAYLNLATFRGPLQGITAASHAVFGHDPATLTRAEAAILAVLLRAPDAEPAQVRQRACHLLGRIERGTDCRQLDALLPGLARATPTPRWHHAELMLDRIPGGGGQRIGTTLDGSWQVRLNAALATQPETAHPAILLADGEAQVLAYTSRTAAHDPWRERVPNPVISALLTMAVQIDSGRLGPESLVAVASPDGLARWGSLRATLSQHSVVATMAWSPRLRRPVAIATPDALDGPMLASLLRALLTDGRWLPPRLLGADAPEPPATPPLLAPAGAFIFAQSWTPVVSGDTCARTLVIEASSAGSLRALAFGEHVMLIRAEGRAALDVTLALARHIAAWQDVRDACGGLPRAPEGVVRRLVDFDPPVEAPRLEWLLSGNPTRVARAGEAYARIEWPADGGIVDGRPAIDDPGHSVEFIAPAAPPHVRWHLDGQRLGEGPRVRWRPSAGRHHLELRTPDGRILDALAFGARGPL